MNYLFLSKEQAAAISVNLAPFFVGREGEVLLCHADIIGNAVYDSVSIDINNLYAFKADIESLNGASLVGISDLAGNFTASNVEGALQELYTGKAPTSHTHVVSNITGLQTALDAKLSSSSVSAYGLTLIDDIDAATARATLGLGTAATAASSSFQPSNTSLTAIAGTTFATGQGVYWTSATTVAVYTLTPFARTVLAATTAAAARATLGAGTGNGTVTSVDITGTTGIAPSGGPITSSGSITLTLSANLQAWSGVTTASKADDASVVHIAGTETITGTKTFGASVSCSSFFNSTGALAGYQLFDRTFTSRSWVFYANNGMFNIYSGNAALDFLKINDTTGAISDRYGTLRSIPLTTQNANYTFVAADAGRGRVKNDTSAYTYTVNNSVFSAGDVLTVPNDSGTGNLTIAAGAGVTLYLAGTTTTGSRTVAPRGVATIFMTSASVGYVSGPGVT